MACFSCHIQAGFALQQDYPLILRLDVFAGLHLARAHNPLNDQIAMLQQDVEAFSALGWIEIREKVAAWYRLSLLFWLGNRMDAKEKARSAGAVSGF